MPATNAVDLLESYSTAIQNEEYVAAQEAAEKLVDVYEDVRIDENRLAAKAALSGDQVEDDDPDSGRLTEFLGLTSEVHHSRGSFFVATAGPVVDPLSASPAKLTKLATDLREKETDYAEKAEAVKPIIDGKTLPPEVDIFDISGPESVVPKGSPFTIDVSLGNLGNEEADQVRLSVDLSPAIDVDRPTDSIGTLPPEASRTRSFDAVAHSSGEYSGSVEVTSSNAGEDFGRIDTFQVQTKTELIEQARDQVESLRDYIVENQPLGEGRSNSVVKRLDSTDEQLQQASEFADDDRPKQANNMLNAANRKLGSILNYLEKHGSGGADKNSRNSGEGKGDSPGNSEIAGIVYGLTSKVEGVIELIAMANRAAI